MSGKFSIAKFVTLGYLVFTLCLLGNNQDVRAENNDFGVWTTLSLDKKLKGKFSLNLTEEIRFFQNAQRLNLAYTNIGLGYKLNKSFKVAIVYRFLQKYQDQNTFSWRHRIYADLQYKQKFYPFTIAYRARIQSQVRDYYSSDDGKIPERYWRNKFDLKYELGHGLSPYLAAEFRYQFKNDRNKSANNKFNRGRYYVGCQYAYSERKTFDLYFMNQREFNVNNPERNYIIGFEYNYAF